MLSVIFLSLSFSGAGIRSDWLSSLMPCCSTASFLRFSSARFCALMSRTVACSSACPASSILVSNTVAGKSSPLRRLCVHSKRWEPSRMAVSIISLAFSAEGRPSGCTSGDTCQGPSAVNSASSLTANIFTVAGLQDVKFHEGGARVITASDELSKRVRWRASLSRSVCSARLRSVSP